MAKALSVDLRRRVVDAVDAGGSCRSAAVNRGVKRGQFPVEYRSILLVQDGPLACVSYS
jgi:transposase